MHQHAAQSIRTAVGIMGLVLVVMALKLGVFAWTGSAAVLSDALESVVNIMTAGLVLFSTWYAARPPDPEHPYGHGRMEFIAAGVEGLLIIGAGLWIAVEAAGRWVAGAQVREPGPGALAMLGLAAVLILAGRAIARRGLALHSESLHADGRHLMIDGLSTLGVGAALLAVAATGWQWLDPLAAFGVCVMVWWGGAALVRRALAGLLDRVDQDDLADIHAILDDERRRGRIESYEKVRLRHDGAEHWVDMHLRFPAEARVDHAHAIASEIEHRIQHHLGRANATAHIEPSPPPEVAAPGGAATPADSQTGTRPA